MKKGQKGWYHYTGSDTVIVFIHGLMSNSSKCWTNEKNGAFWPDLVINDERFSSPNIFLAEFHTNLTSGDYKITDCSSEVFRSLTIEDEFSRGKVVDKKNIIFIGHSTGGIVARHIVESNQDTFIGKNIGFALYASPSLGSKWANKLSYITRIFNNQLMKELQWGNSVLIDLDDRFKNLIQSSKLNIKGFEAYENKSPFIGMPKIVERQSAGIYFSAPKNIPNTDHSTIVKPSSKSSASHELLVLFFQENKNTFKSESKKTAEPTRISLSRMCNNNTADPLFEFYTPINKRYYLERDLDNQITQTINRNHLWLCGPSGVGKTVSLQKAISELDTSYKYISLGMCINEKITYMLSEILSELSPEFEITENNIGYLIKNISSIIRSHCKIEAFILHIEEIPISNKADFNEFSTAIYSLLVSLRDLERFTLVLSSIYEPADIKDTEFEKISESFKLIKIKEWSKEDIIKLVKLICRSTDIDFESHLSNIKSYHTPRDIKIYYRDYIAQVKIRA